MSVKISKNRKFALTRGLGAKASLAFVAKVVFTQRRVNVDVVTATTSWLRALNAHLSSREANPAGLAPARNHADNSYVPWSAATPP